MSMLMSVSQSVTFLGMSFGGLSAHLGGFYGLDWGHLEFLC